MSKVRYEDYLNEEDNDEVEVHFQKNKKKRINDKFKEYNGHKPRNKNKFKKLRKRNEDED